MSVDSTIRKAQKLARAGDRDGAATLLRQVLAKSPGNRTAREGLAALARATAAAAPSPGTAPGRPASGPQPAPKVLRAVEALVNRGAAGAAVAEAQRLSLLFPTSPQVFNLLGLALTRAGRPAEAVKAFTRLCHLSPSSTGALVNQATALFAARRFDEAAEATGKALALDATLWPAANLRGYALLQAGHQEAAEQAFRTAIRIAPDRPQGHLGLGHLLAATGRKGDALAAYRTALAKDPANADAANNVGALLMASDRLPEAAEVLGRAIEQHPKNRMLRTNMAKVLRDLEQPEAAIGHIDAALELGPETGAQLMIKASCLSAIGAFDQATDLLDRARALEPDQVEIQIYRSRIDPGAINADERALMARALADENRPQKERATLGFALFRAQDAAGEIDAGAHTLEQANALQRAAHPYDIEAQARVLAALTAGFDGAGPVLSAADIAQIPAKQRIVFIVGMPRSGTTLVEQILASHSQVHGAGELRLLRSAMAELGWKDARIGAGPDRESLKKLRRSYLAGLAQRGIDAPVVTDKMPINFRHLGHALAAFPDARALVLDRDARAVCWSNWKHDFRGGGNGFGNDLADLARMYRLHLEVIARYRAAYPDRIATVPYERLTEHQEEESRKLVAAAGLDWEPACLDFHETRRAVRTASVAQVRQQMYTGSSEAWRRYEAHLGPLFAALEAHG